jgi:phage portal protein BeeE
MGFLGRLADRTTRGASTTDKSGTIDDWWAEFGASSVSSGGMAVTQVSALQVATVLSCVSIRSEDVAKLPVHVYRQRSDGGRVIVKDHPVEMLLQRPNSYQSRFEFMEQMMVALMLRGNAYAVILRDGRGRPTSLVPISPERVWIYEAPGGEVFYQVARRGLHEMAVLANEPLMIPSEDIFHLRWRNLPVAYPPTGLTLAACYRPIRSLARKRLIGWRKHGKNASRG